MNKTPSAETSPLWCASDAPHDKHRERNEFGGWNECTGRPAATPPRIEDMAPGTTFTAGLNEDWSSRPHRQWTVRSSAVVWCASEGFGVQTRRIDPSTIRDVTPPKESS